ncbi:putative transcription factor C2H2 family [Helianthus annuus]|uniref:Putative zinc finger, RING/FYVE/PHD-type n=1 Tax=Helianthus annuus TaxID=4232 RepID=A0A251VJS9_HELAN|nr:E3 ubiquitin-protein ligase RFWD3 [Helianthus annuus]KAF5819366.1 putative transcription factor C2H2 family [Helianthus annuus]
MEDNNNNTSIDMEEDPAVVEFEEEQDNIDDEEEDEDDDDYEEEEEEDDDDDDYEDEEVEELISSNECEPVIKKNGGGGDDEEKNETKRDEFDVCSICLESWTSGGDHRICCLPCGHIYGMSCIRKWLVWCQSDGKCPKCKSLCTLKDIRVLYATRLCVADEKPHEASTINFPYTREGFNEFQQYVFSCMDELKQRAEDFDSRLHILQQICDELRAQAPENSR